MRNKGAIDTSCELGEWFRKVEKIRSTGGTVERVGFCCVSVTEWLQLLRSGFLELGLHMCTL